MKTAAWLSFWTLGLIWGSSFLLIRIGVEDIPATQLVLIRTATAAVFLNLVLLLKGKRPPGDWSTLRALLIIGVGNAAIPYTLISLGEQNISSGMAAVLQATASLFTLVIAHFAFVDERVTRKKIIGLIVGFGGVFVLSSGSFQNGSIDLPMFLGQMAIVGASMFYAVFIVYSRKVINRDVEPLVVSATTFVSATACAAVFVVLEPLLGGRAYIPLNDLPDRAILVAFGLGFVNTFIAYLFFYFIIQELGAFRASMVTYIVPVVGLALGWLVLDEVVAPYMILGAMMIFAGIGIINLRLRRLFQLRNHRGLKVADTA
ncbi:MAG: DMT family transporter [Chloroflexota bacterium]